MPALHSAGRARGSPVPGCSSSSQTCPAAGMVQWSCCSAALCCCCLHCCQGLCPGPTALPLHCARVPEAQSCQLAPWGLPAPTASQARIAGKGNQSVPASCSCPVCTGMAEGLWHLCTGMERACDTSALAWQRVCDCSLNLGFFLFALCWAQCLRLGQGSTAHLWVSFALRLGEALGPEQGHVPWQGCCCCGLCAQRVTAWHRSEGVSEVICCSPLPWARCAPSGWQPSCRAPPPPPCSGCPRSERCK